MGIMEINCIIIIMSILNIVYLFVITMTFYEFNDSFSSLTVNNVKLKKLLLINKGTQ